VTDLSGKSDDFTLYDSPTYFTTEAGYLKFDAGTDYAMNTSSFYQFGVPITVSAWVKTGLDFRIEQKSASSPSVSWALSYITYGSSLFAYFSFTLGNSVGVEVYVIMDYNRWYNVCAVNTGSQVNFYLNGTLVKSASVVRSVPSIPDSRVKVFPGVSLSALSVYGRALTGVEVSRNYEALRSRFSILGRTYLESDFPSAVCLTVSGTGTDLDGDCFVLSKSYQSYEWYENNYTHYVTIDSVTGLQVYALTYPGGSLVSRGMTTSYYTATLETSWTASVGSISVTLTDCGNTFGGFQQPWSSGYLAGFGNDSTAAYNDYLSYKRAVVTSNPNWNNDQPIAVGSVIYYRSCSSPLTGFTLMYVSDGGTEWELDLDSTTGEVLSITQL
jgi:hypothetical protein